MIEQNESGLTVTQYENVTSAIERQIWKIEAHRWNLEFSEYTLPYSIVDSSPKFDVVVVNGVFAHMTDGDVHIFDEDGTNHQSYTIPDSYVTSIHPSLIELDNDLYVFVALTTTTIRRYRFNVSSNSISLNSSVDIATGATAISHFTPTSIYQIHFTDFDATTNLHQLKVATFSGSWSIISSDIYWQYPIDSMDSIESPDNLNADVIVMVTQVPANIIIRAENDTITKELEQNAGIISFVYRNETWSDHFLIESISNIQSYRYRRIVKANVINGKIFAMVYGVDGTNDFNYPLYRYYTSKNGINWSLGSGIDITKSMGTYGAKLVLFGENVYVFQNNKAFKSISTMLTGSQPDSLKEDISQYVMDARLTHERSLQSEIQLANPFGYFDNHPIINNNNIVVLIHYAGYHVDGEDVFLQIGITEIDNIEYQYQLGKETISLVGRDRIAWMADKSQSQEPYYQDGQLLGGDEYLNYTDTSYGGLRHTAPQKGTWETNNNRLELRSNNEEGIAFQTFSAFLWNGDFKSKFELSTLNNDEYAGIVFRAVDKDNNMQVIYKESTDTLYLIERRNNLDTIVSSIDLMGWDNLTTHWLWVQFKYARIYVYASDDGVTWTQLISYLQSGQPASGTTTMLLDKGYVGHIGKGYSANDTWDVPDWSMPDYNYTPFDFDGNYDYDFDDPVVINNNNPSTNNTIDYSTNAWMPPVLTAYVDAYDGTTASINTSAPTDNFTGDQSANRISALCMATKVYLYSYIENYRQENMLLYGFATNVIPSLGALGDIVATLLDTTSIGYSMDRLIAMSDLNAVDQVACVMYSALINKSISALNFSQALDTAVYSSGSNEYLIWEAIKDSLDKIENYLSFINILGNMYNLITIYGIIECGCNDITYVNFSVLTDVNWSVALTQQSSLLLASPNPYYAYNTYPSYSPSVGNPAPSARSGWGNNGWYAGPIFGVIITFNNPVTISGVVFDYYTNLPSPTIARQFQLYNSAGTIISSGHTSASDATLNAWETHTLWSSITPVNNVKKLQINMYQVATWYNKNDQYQIYIDNIGWT